MTPNQPDSEKPIATYNTETPATTDNTNTSREVEKTLLWRLWRRSRNIAASLIIALWAQGLLTWCSPDNEPNIIKPEENISINVSNNGANNIDISNSPIVKIEGNTLRIGYNTMAQWPENIPSSDVKIIISPSKYFSSKTEITSWSTLSQDLKWQYLWVEVKWKKALIWELVDKAEEQINKLQNLNYKVDEPIDLTLWGTLNIKQASFEIDWEVIPLETSNAIFPWPWNWILHFTIIKSDWTTKDQDININVKAIEFTGNIDFPEIDDKEILPIIWEVEDWNKNFYKSIEHLWIPKAIKTIQMMIKNGTKNLSPEQYKQRMSKLQPVMIWECPTWFDVDDYNPIWNLASTPWNHAHKEFFILKTLLPKEIKPNIINSWLFNNDYTTLKNLWESNPDKIFITSNSICPNLNVEEYSTYTWDNLIECSKWKNIIVFWWWTNIEMINGVLKNQINQWNVQPNRNSVYARVSNAHNQNDYNRDKHIFVTIPANNQEVSLDGASNGGKFPEWFADGINGVLFSWRWFATHNAITWHIEAETVPSASITNYVNNCLMCLCYLLYPESNSVSELMEEIKSTADINYIKLNWKTATLILINPKNLYTKKMIPENLPNKVKKWEIIPLHWYYNCEAFSWPWIEVNINGDWKPCNKSTENIIKSQDLHLDYRFNQNLCRKMGYSWLVPIKCYNLDDESWWKIWETEFQLDVE